jgi:hypothetical protein
LKKPGGFIGKTACVQKKARGKPTRRLAQVLVKDPGPFVVSCRSGHRNGKPVGYVRSGAYGYTLGGAVGLFMIEADEAIDQAYIDAGQWEIDIAGSVYPAIVSLSPLYDPKMEKINGPDQHEEDGTCRHQNNKGPDILRCIRALVFFCMRSPQKSGYRIWLRNSLVRSWVGLVKKCSGVPTSTMAPASMKITRSATFPGKAHFVGHHHHGHALLGQGLHDVQDLTDHFRIQRRRGLVEEHDFGIHGQGPGNGHPLLLSAGKLVRKDIFLSTMPTFLRRVMAFSSGCHPPNVCAPLSGPGSRFPARSYGETG